MRPGLLMGDFSGLDSANLGPKMALSWGPDRTKINANIDRMFDAFENRNLDGKSWYVDGKITFFGLHQGWIFDNFDISQLKERRP